ncbi:50S ribosomal protein L17 [bacterium]|nr:50S ribosomal protein L17 [bacterium]MCP5463272.1 50S ribosomal protein L17 [bacterium]
MRHRKLNTQLNRSKTHRAATLRNIVQALFTHERVTTTVKKAKVSARFADKMITLAKKNNLAAIRRAVSLLHDKDVVKKLFNEIGPRYVSRAGGYTRVLKIQNRKGDGAEVAILELTEKEVMPVVQGESKKTNVAKTSVHQSDSRNKKDIEDVAVVEELETAKNDKNVLEEDSEKNASSNTKSKDSTENTEDTSSKKV